jgi:FtsP/CotA-like multicopper oxidase with cupredoxin domain
VDNGLYGPLLVEDPRQTGLGDEVVLVLSDSSVDEHGVSPPDLSGDLGLLFGREGNLLLVNGKFQPRLHARSGLLQRWRIVNTARTRYYQLAMAGHSFRRIGGDGGLMEYPVDAERIVLAPAERADVLVVPQGAPGSEVAVRWVAFDRGFGSTVNRPDENLFYVRFAENPHEPPEALPATSRAMEALDISAATEVRLELVQVSTPQQPLELGINGVPASRATPLQAKLGETQIWTIVNHPGMDFAHPFHLHGFFFQPLDDQGLPARPLEWKDTLNVAVNGTRRFAVRFDERPGTWMFHCHILDHADVGMMGMVNVGEASGAHGHQ